MKLGIYGAGGSGENIFDLAMDIQENVYRWDEILFIDDVRTEKMFLSKRILPFIELKTSISPDDIEIAISLGEPKYRRILYERVKAAGYRLAQMIDPKSHISPVVSLGEGVIIMNDGLSGLISIGDNVLIFSQAVIGHNSTIGSNCVISVTSFIGGSCAIGNDVYIGPHAMVKDRLTVGNRAVVGMGAALLTDLNDDYAAFGNPARALRRREDEKLF